MIWATTLCFMLDHGLSRRGIWSFLKAKNLAHCTHYMSPRVMKEHSLCVAKLVFTKLWHSQLDHMSKKGMKILQHSSYIPVLMYLEFSLREHCI